MAAVLANCFMTLGVDGCWRGALASPFHSLIFHLSSFHALPLSSIPLLPSSFPSFLKSTLISPPSFLLSPFPLIPLLPSPNPPSSQSPVMQTMSTSATVLPLAQNRTEIPPKATDHRANLPLEWVVVRIKKIRTRRERRPGHSPVQGPQRRGRVGGGAAEVRERERSSSGSSPPHQTELAQPPLFSLALIPPSRPPSHYYPRPHMCSGSMFSITR